MPELPPDIPKPLQARNIHNYTVDDFFRFIETWEPNAPLPAPYLYSNTSVGLLGHLLADTLGKNWMDLVRERITEPLGMVDTVLELSGDQQKRRALGYRAKWSSCTALAHLRVVPGGRFEIHRP
jgi:CubicO group peptidase (beta-lactamase class C family)